MEFGVIQAGSLVADSNILFVLGSLQFCQINNPEVAFSIATSIDDVQQASERKRRGSVVTSFHPYCKQYYLHKNKPSNTCSSPICVA